MNAKLDEQYKTRIDKDTIFFGASSVKYDGLINKNVEFIEKVQLKNPELWRMVTAQFGTSIDDCDKGWRGEYWGKLMRGACMAYKYTRDRELYGILEMTVIELIEKQEGSGRLSTYSEENEFSGWDMWCRKYLALGMLHFYEICNYEVLKKQIIDFLTGHIDYIIERIGEGKIEICETSNYWSGANSCSILEPVVRFYNITGKKEYLDFAEYIVSTGFVGCGNLIECALEDKYYPSGYPIVKAYEVMSCFEGLLELYRVTGKEDYRRAVENFTNRIMEAEVSITGCAGSWHENFSNSRISQTRDNGEEVLQETCVTVTWMKLCYQMYCLTGDVKYAEEIERSAYNALFGAVNTRLVVSEWGLFHFDSYSPVLFGRRGVRVGGLKYMPGGTYGCCAAIGAAGLALLPEFSVMQSRDGIIFNMFEEGVVKTETPTGGAVTFIEKTDYPFGGNIKLTLEIEAPAEFEIKIRIPEFSKHTAITINGEKEEFFGGRKYFSAKRQWCNGDEIEISFEMKLVRIDSFDGNDKYKAFKYGSLVLVRDKRFDENTGNAISIVPDALCNMVPTEVGGKEYELRFDIKTKSGNNICLIDYMSAGKTLDEESAFEAWIAQGK